MEESLHCINELTIINVPQEELDYKVFEFICDKKIGDNFKNKKEILDKLPIGLKNWFVTWQLESEVYNGGFNQYFYNTTDEFVEDAIQAYKYFGLYKIAKIVEEVVNLAIGEIEMLGEAKRKGTLDAFLETYEFSQLGKIDKLFYKSDSDISETRISFIKKNLQDFLCDSQELLKLRDTLNKNGLTRVAEKIINEAKNSIILKTQKVTEDEIIVGETKIGGTPDIYILNLNGRLGSQNIYLLLLRLN